MSVIAMKVKSVNKHPNADFLRLYIMEAPEYDEVQIIANLENIYEVDDVVAIALTGSVLKNGTKIKVSKIRGIPSFGMALGKVNEFVGRDISEVYCQKNIEKSVTIQKWPSIELLYNVRRSLDLLGEKPKITYHAKIKLDGTNAGVQIFTDGRVAAQSRTQIITTESDNMGFANWVSKNIDYFANIPSDEHLTFFGEWCGQGIQKRTAISQIDRKIFVVFAIQLGGLDGKVAKLEIQPQKICNYLPKHPDIFVLPFYGDPITLDFANKAQLQTSIDTINQMIEDVEKIDPWVKDVFEIEGLGEGLVLYPQPNTLVKQLSYSELLFKAKGEKHQVVKTKKSVQIAPEVAKSIDEFVDLFVTSTRLEQGIIEACDSELNMQKMGVFLQWLISDVKKESVAELEDSKLIWKDVSKAVMNSAREWYKKRVISNI